MSGTGGIPNTEQRGAESAPEQIHKEGAQYLKEATQANQANQSGANSGTAADEGTGTNISRSAPEPVHEDPAAGKSAFEDPTGGIAKGAGGVSGSAYVESPVHNEEQGIVNTVKSFLGLSLTEEKRAEDTQPAWNAGSVTALPGIGSSTAAPAVAVAAASGSSYNSNDMSNSGSFTAEIPDRTKPSTLANTEPVGAVGSYSISTGPDYNDGRSVPLDKSKAPDNSTSTSSRLPSTLNNPGSSEPEPAVTAGSHMTTTGPDFSANEGTRTVPSALCSTTNSKSHTDRGTMEDPVPHKSQPADADEKDAHKPPKPASAGGKAHENPSAIPSAGGEKLGEKHWGESEIVPDLPKKRDSDAGQSGVSSSAGQPTSEVADNTAANTGGASSGPHGGNESAEKQGAMDKIKGKLHIGGSK
ncbi:hypothetical protein Slin15195_G074550 [Septoria linicola]|uniref:Uncharacterized protein n=1 Tax=Septoria linicola TaxID=215465 RepID=A0A9Q9EJU5_9PEZI|nr:hypothetical protein Slin14017_G035670 [Septoria linicola]USW54136.1 hypothetical protein Slin15195_G074550 [Septoria linicola]